MADAERFLVVAFTDQWPEGQPLANWPQHMTVTPWMVGDKGVVISAVAAVAAEVKPLEVSISGLDEFGPDHDIPVWTLGPREQLVGLHKAVVRRIGEAAALDDDTYAGDRYAPHMSVKPSQPRHSLGDRLVLRSLSVIGKDAGQKIIHRNLPLHGQGSF
ncbi:MAG: 2'-5' RNA ligase family protein [Candidatus Saccharibacteria bacterium]